METTATPIIAHFTQGCREKPSKNHNAAGANKAMAIANNIQKRNAKRPTGRLKVRLFVPKNVKSIHAIEMGIHTFFLSLDNGFFTRKSARRANKSM